MTDKESILIALRSAYKANPNDTAIALHLASLLIEEDIKHEALSLFQEILGKDPKNKEALVGAFECAKDLHDVTLAEAYRQMLSAFEYLDNNENSNNPVSPIIPKLRVIGGTEVENDILDSEKPGLKLSDVGGMEEVKRRLELSFLSPLRNPQLMSAYGKNVSGGLMLYGPPGCGKTFIARALAGELEAKFINVGLADVLDMYLGESERRLHELFENARRITPAVLFFDELDALGQKRSHLRNSAMRSVVNQLLAEMDSVGSDNSNLFMIGATNHPWDVDAALKRPGRFDRMVAVFPPNETARKSILEYHLRSKPVNNLDTNSLAKLTDSYSGADLRYLVDNAVDYAIEKSLNNGEIEPLMHKHFELPLREIRPSTHTWFETAKNYALFANEGGTYDELLAYMRKHKL